MTDIMVELQGDGARHHDRVSPALHRPADAQVRQHVPRRRHTQRGGRESRPGDRPADCSPATPPSTPTCSCGTTRNRWKRRRCRSWPSSSLCLSCRCGSRTSPTITGRWSASTPSTGAGTGRDPPRRRLRPARSPLANYPRLDACTPAKCIVALYQDLVVELDREPLPDQSWTWSTRQGLGRLVVSSPNGSRGPSSTPPTTHLVGRSVGAQIELGSSAGPRSQVPPSGSAETRAPLIGRPAETPAASVQKIPRTNGSETCRTKRTALSSTVRTERRRVDQRRPVEAATETSSSASVCCTTGWAFLPAAGRVLGLLLVSNRAGADLRPDPRDPRPVEELHQYRAQPPATGPQRRLRDASRGPQALLPQGLRGLGRTTSWTVSTSSSRSATCSTRAAALKGDGAEDSRRATERMVDLLAHLKTEIHRAHHEWKQRGLPDLERKDTGS